MKEFSARDMMDALRLTRQGRLKEAAAALRGRTADGADNAPFSGIMSDALQSLGRLGRSPLLEGLPGLGPLSANLARQAQTASPVSRFEERSFTNEAGSRKYRLYVPSSYNGAALPLVVMLHGCTQSPEDFAAGTQMNEIAEQLGFFVAYPAQAGSANISRCWNWFSPADQQRAQGEPSMIAGITHQIMSDFSIQTGKVYVAGLSAGGAMAATMGVTYPDLFAAIGVHSGLACGAASDLASAMAAMRRGGKSTVRDHATRVMPTIVFHGDRDTTVNIANAEQVVAQAKADMTLQAEIISGKSADGIAYTRTVQSTAGRPVLEEWVLHGAKHAWSGGSPAGSFTQAGPDASAEMIRFFFAQ